MKMTIEAVKPGTGETLKVDIGADQWGDNVVITRTDNYMDSSVPVQISFPLNAETARALSFGLGELAKELGKQK